jgi:hypothetical protein
LSPSLPLPSRVSAPTLTNLAGDLRHLRLPGFACIGVFRGCIRAEARLLPAFDPCCSPGCSSADQTAVCAISRMPGQPTSGLCSTDESVVPKSVAKHRHPILPWVLFPSKVHRRRRWSDSAGSPRCAVVSLQPSLPQFRSSCRGAPCCPLKSVRWVCLQSVSRRRSLPEGLSLCRGVYR